jgi:DNA gyrase subunit B
MSKKKIKKYDSNMIRTPGDIELVRINTSFYIGSTETATHLIDEVLDNALDEVLESSADEIILELDTKNHIYSISDNGRGIPISNNTPFTIATKLHSGAKFQDKKEAYKICSGMHGVGLVAVNALSNFMNIEIYRNNQYAIFQFENGNLKDKKLIIKKKPKNSYSTKITFQPNKEYFESQELDLKRIKRRIKLVSAELSSIVNILLKIDNEEFQFQQTKMERYFEECGNGKGEKDFINYFKVNSNVKEEEFNFIMGYMNNGNIMPKIISSINLLPVDDGGTHVNWIFAIIKEYLTNKAKKYKMVFQPNDVLNRLRIYLSLKLEEPKYSGQTKYKLATQKKYFEKFKKDIEKQLNQYFSKNEKILIEILQSFHDYRHIMNSKRFQLNTNGKKKRGSVIYTKLRDCKSKNGELYITEGESAGGCLINARNPLKHAVFPMKGKPINLFTTKRNVMENKEMAELINAFGTGIEPDFNLSNLRYNKIIIASDADPAGNHITDLLIMNIAKLTPQLIRSGKIYVAETPLYAINENKTFIPLWTDEEYEEARKNNKKITRFKGLGEFNSWQLRICLLNDNTRRLIQLKYSTEMNSLENLFSANPDEKRKLLNDDTI